MIVIDGIVSEHDGGKGITEDNPLTVPRTLSLKPIYHTKGTDHAGTKFRWKFWFVRPHQSDASDFPIRVYGMDGNAMNPKIEIPELKESHDGEVGIFRVTCTHSEGTQTFIRDFYIRNRTKAEKKEAKDARWKTLERELKKPNMRRISCAGGVIDAHMVLITLMNELFPGTAYTNMFGNWLSSHYTNVVSNRLLEARHYLEQKLEDPDYGEVEEETSPDPGPVPEPDTDDSDGVDVDSDAGDDSGTEPQPRPKDLDILLNEITASVQEALMAMELIDGCVKRLDDLANDLSGNRQYIERLLEKARLALKELP